MKRTFLFVLSCFFIITGILSAEKLPSDTSYLIEEKYANHSGVIQVWTTQGRNTVNWLNACASEFEASNPGIYIYIEEVTASAITDLQQSRITLPDIIIYPASTEPAQTLLKPITTSYPIRSAISYTPYAIPILLYPKFWIYNTSLIPSIPADMYEVSVACKPDDLNALVALCTGLRSPETSDITLPGIDFNLPIESTPAQIPAGSIQCRIGPNLKLSESPLNLFLSNQAAAFVGDASAILKLSAEVNCSAAVTGNYVYTDAATMFSIINKDNTNHRACMAYLDKLMTYGQAITSRAKAFPAVTGVSSWTNDITLSSVEAATESSTWILRATGSSSAAQLYIEEKITADEAMARILAE